MEIDKFIDQFAEISNEDPSVVVQKTLAQYEQGIVGNKLEFYNPVMEFDEWNFSLAAKLFGGKRGLPGMQAELGTNTGLYRSPIQ